uniref:PHD-type domain-containing protein n=1 Tax=Arcella intermedia TaxID=1963864 RepID=A0A6B2LW40_9EUKA
MLCDCCNDPYHMFCLPRPLAEVPLGEWFCESCYVLDQNHSLMTYLSAKKKKKGVQGTSI